MSRRVIGIGVGVVILGVVLLTAAALLMQTNPPVQAEPAWDSPQTRALAQRACFDCHSNETVWPWYDKLPGSSWLVVFDVVRGRNHLNFSEWGAQASDGEGEDGERGGHDHEFAEVIQEGEMPPAIYLTMHPTARLTDAEKQQLIQGLENLLK